MKYLYLFTETSKTIFFAWYDQKTFFGTLDTFILLKLYLKNYQREYKKKRITYESTKINKNFCTYNLQYLITIKNWIK